MGTRILIPLAIALILLTVLGDPYTFHLNGSDHFVVAPRWQSTVALLDALFLLAGAILVLRNLPRAALLTLGGELLYALAFNAILVQRDGFERFIWGLGAESHSLVFLLTFGLRLAVLGAVHFGQRSTPPKDRAA